jgi:homoserine dehydrogenase
MKKELTIGLFGFGVVGQGLHQVISQTKGIKASIKKIVIKNAEKPRTLPKQHFTTDANDVLYDPNINVIVELIDDADAAFSIVKQALQNGKDVVTANKKMLAEHLEEIYDLQQKTGKSVLYEGSVCGSIPIIRNLEEYYDNDLITSIEGIFNGSTNYILTKIFEEKKSYADALTKAQELGFAESNPDLDVLAFDPKFKLIIAIAHTFGVFVKPDEVINIGITHISETDVRFAKENGFAIKLVARAFKQGGKIYGFVAPQLVNQTHTLYSVRNEFNAVQVEGAFAEKQLFVGKGAGSFPTASAVLSDISALNYHYQYEYKKRTQGAVPEFSNALQVEALVSFEKGKGITKETFEHFQEGYAWQGQEILRGFITLEKLAEIAKQPGISILLAPDARLNPIKIKQEAEAII